ncbi:hypothetical protein F4780DRAFT_781696 [Xylariomycetidae sp. FL0641]|nr:hypothetical protein F4780DRAFT_781696 [Xylariomycetidae sp. FL0641]
MAWSPSSTNTDDSVPRAFDRSNHEVPTGAKLRNDAKKWMRFAGIRRKSGTHGDDSHGHKPSERRLRSPEPVSEEFPGHLTNRGNLISQATADDVKQMHIHVQKIRNKFKKDPVSINQIDSICKEYELVRERSLSMCRALLTLPSHRRQTSLVSPTSSIYRYTGSDTRRSSSRDTPDLISPRRTKNSIDALSPLTSQEEQRAEAVREWEKCLEFLAETLRRSLLETYNRFETGATPQGFEEICADKEARRPCISRMRETSIEKMVSADLSYFPKYRVRFFNYDTVRKDLAEVRLLLYAGGTGIAAERTIHEHTIKQDGDVMLEFANKECDAYPVHRFRVSSHFLKETRSPIFTRMLLEAGPTTTTTTTIPSPSSPPPPPPPSSSSPDPGEPADGLAGELPPPPTYCRARDGAEVLLYRMPQTELNAAGSLEVLLHAAHAHFHTGAVAAVPRALPFAAFAAVAAACLRYRCAGNPPLLLFAESFWLPQWRAPPPPDAAAPARLDDLLAIAQAFGLRADFRALSRVAVLVVADERGRPWPGPVRRAVAAARRARFDQVFARARREWLAYVDPAPETETEREPGEVRHKAGPTRCPRGDPACDARNLGWLTRALARLGLLPRVLGLPPPSPSPSSSPSPSPSSSSPSDHHHHHHHPAALADRLPAAPPRQSLLQLLDALRAVEGPARDGICCDPAPPFRAAVAEDVLNSVEGLDLRRVVGGGVVGIGAEEPMFELPDLREFARAARGQVPTGLLAELEGEPVVEVEKEREEEEEEEEDGGDDGKMLVEDQEAQKSLLELREQHLSLAETITIGLREEDGEEGEEDEGAAGVRGG